MPDPANTPEDPVLHNETPGGGRAGRESIRAAFFGRPSRGQFLVAALLAVLGYGAATQVRLTNTDEDLTGTRREDLIALLDSLGGASDRAQIEIDDLKVSRDELQSNSSRRAEALAQSREQLTVLGILSGTVPATGPGVSITIEDPDSSVTAAALLNGIEELRDAGAESIEFNDTVRVVASTAITQSGGLIYLDDVAIRPPYIIDAIGSSHTLSEAVVFPGGLADQVEELGGTTAVEERDTVDVASLHTIEPPQYSQPAG